MNIIRSRILDQKIAFQVTKLYLSSLGSLLSWFGLFILVLFILQWLFSIDQLLIVVFSNNGLTLLDKTDFLVSGFFNIFRYSNDVIPISMIVIAVLQSLLFGMLFKFGGGFGLRRSAGALGLSSLGISCVACGGSILGPILSGVGVAVSTALARNITTGLLVLAVILSYTSLISVAVSIAATRHSS